MYCRRVLYCCLSLSCFLIASSTTYGLGGFLRYGSSGSSSGSDGKAASGGDDGMWQFFQPFSGGMRSSSSSGGNKESGSCCQQSPWHKRKCCNDACQVLALKRCLLCH